jgi:hypothetical protein
MRGQLASNLPSLAINDKKTESFTVVRGTPYNTIGCPNGLLRSFKNPKLHLRILNSQVI